MRRCMESPGGKSGAPRHLAGRLDRAGAALVSAMRVLPVAGEPLKQHHSPNSKMPQAWSSVRVERMIERVHLLGPRPLSELLAEIVRATGQPAVIADHVEAYARLDPEIVRALGADSFAPMPLGVVR